MQLQLKSKLNIAWYDIYINNYFAEEKTLFVQIMISCDNFNKGNFTLTGMRYILLDEVSLLSKEMQVRMTSITASQTAGYITNDKCQQVLLAKLIDGNCYQLESIDNTRQA